MAVTPATIQQVRYEEPIMTPTQMAMGSIGSTLANFLQGALTKKDEPKTQFEKAFVSLVQQGMLKPSDKETTGAMPYGGAYWLPQEKPQSYSDVNAYLNFGQKLGMIPTPLNYNQASSLVNREEANSFKYFTPEQRESRVRQLMAASMSSQPYQYGTMPTQPGISPVATSTILKGKNKSVLDRIRQAREAGYSDADIASSLTDAGFDPMEYGIV